eukprot:6481225-Heterocapsa_arctica.AAC.1
MAAGPQISPGRVPARWGRYCRMLWPSRAQVKLQIPRWTRRPAQQHGGPGRARQKCRCWV